MKVCPTHSNVPSGVSNTLSVPIYVSNTLECVFKRGVRGGVLLVDEVAEGVFVDLRGVPEKLRNRMTHSVSIYVSNTLDVCPTHQSVSICVSNTPICVSNTLECA